MTITFNGHVSSMSVGGPGEVELTIETPMDPCGGQVIRVRIPAAQAQHWLPNRIVSFTLYTLSDDLASVPRNVEAADKGGSDG